MVYCRAGWRDMSTSERCRTTTKNESMNHKRSTLTDRPAEPKQTTAANKNANARRVAIYQWLHEPFRCCPLQNS